MHYLLKYILENGPRLGNRLVGLVFLDFSILRIKKTIGHTIYNTYVSWLEYGPILENGHSQLRL